MKKILSALALAITATFAAAGPVTIDPDVSLGTGNLTLKGWEHPGATTMTLFVGSAATSAGVGGLKATFADPFNIDNVDNFIAWCVEIFTRASPFGDSAAYEQVGAISTPVNAVAKLFAASNALNTSDVNVTFGGAAVTDGIVKSAGLQLALWELLYDANPVDVTSGNFFATGGDSNGDAMRTHANLLLGTMNGFTVDSYNVTLFTDVNITNKGYQDFITVTRTSGFGQVPEPGTLALAGLGLLGAGFARRRKA